MRGDLTKRLGRGGVTGRFENRDFSAKGRRNAKLPPPPPREDMADSERI